jgi:Tol biopolymer transport system component
VAEIGLDNWQLRHFDKPPNESWWQPNYLPDGSVILFISGKLGDRYNQISMLSFDEQGRHIARHLTESEGNKSHPAGSPDGARVIYGRTTAFRRSTNTPGNIKIFELDVGAGIETAALSEEGFIRISPLTYLPDGKRFLFSGVLLGQRADVADKYRALYKDNNVFIWARGQTGLVPAFSRRESSYYPQISRNGHTISFISEIDHADLLKSGRVSADIYVMSQGTIRRVTEQSSYIQSQTLSPDGTKVFFIGEGRPSSRRPSEEDANRLWMINVDGTGLTEIVPR